MKTLNKEELKAVAADIFGRYNKAEKVAVTSDGMAFITDESDNAVLNHSKHNVSGKELKIERFTRDEVVTLRQSQGAASSAKGGKKTEDGKKEAVKGKQDTGKGEKADVKPKTEA